MRRCVFFLLLSVPFVFFLSNTADGATVLLRGGRSLEVGSFGFVPFCAVMADDIAVYRMEGGGKVKDISVKRLVLTVDPLTLVREGRLVTTVVFSGLSVKDVVPDSGGTLRVVSTFRSILNPFPADAISVIKADIMVANSGEIGDDRGENISGTVSFGPGCITSAEFRMDYNGIPYLLKLKKELRRPLYILKLSSDGFILEGGAQISGPKLVIEGIKGMFCGVKLSFSGVTDNFKTPLKSETSLLGNARADLGKMRDLADKGKMFVMWPGRTANLAVIVQEIGGLISENGVSGEVHADFTLKGRGLVPSQYSGESNFLSDEIIFRDMKLEKVEGKVSAFRNNVNVPFFRADFYGGEIEGAVYCELRGDGTKYEARITARDIDFGAMMGDTGEKKSVLDMSFLIKGMAGMPESRSGKGSIAIMGGKLEKRAVLKPLADHIESLFGGEAAISGARSDIYIEGNRVIADNFTLWGNGFYLTSKGTVQGDGKLALEFAVFSRPAGEHVCTAFLKGTLENPEWTFERMMR